jgi:peptidyl-prolyl cis-trans isomerase D
MISWIQRYFQHHFKTIFAVLLAVTIISFIFTIGASPGIGRGDRRVVQREFFGYNLGMADDEQRLMGDASLSASLQVGAMGGLDNEQVQQYAFQRAASLYLADQWHIPSASPAEIKEAITKLRMFAGPNGEFDAKAYATFRDNVAKSQNGATAADITRVISDDVRVEKVNKLLAGPGYVLPHDVKSQLERADTTWTLATATADYGAFKPDIKPTDAELTKFFEDNSFRYEVPPRVDATYVEFPSSQFVPSVKVTDADVRAYYDENPARFPKPPEPKTADGKPAPVKPTTPDQDFAAVQSQVRAALILDRAQKLAVKAASDLAVAIFESKVTNGPALDALLTSRKLQEKKLAPFSREEGPAELGHSPAIANEAFRLNKDHFVSDAMPSPNGAVVLFWKDVEAAHKPLFADVHAKVTADYIENEKRKRFVELGKTAKSQIETRLKAGDSFDKAVAAVSASTGLKFDTKTLAPFTLRSRPQDVDYTILGSLDHLDKGQVSDMVLNPDKGIFVYAQDKKLPDLSDKNPQYAETREQLASLSSRIAGSAYISELVDRELKRTEPKPE